MPTLQQLATDSAVSGPVFIYDLNAVRERSKLLAGLSLPYGFVPRYAVKANNHPKVVKAVADEGIHFDASSSYEASELLSLGVEGKKISLSSQQPAHNLEELLAAGIQYVATSLHQLKLVLEASNKPKNIGLRVNPGIGSGGNNRTTTGGINSSFGLWHEYIPDALQIAQQNAVSINRLHIHIGSGASTDVWGKVMDEALKIVELMPDVYSLDIGGGYKVHRFSQEEDTNMSSIASVFSEKLRNFSEQNNRQLQLEVEPGTWLVAKSGVLIAQIVDIVDTGSDGHTFIKLNTGMNDFLRPSIYGSQHKIRVLNSNQQSAERREYVVVGHNCETGDILTPAAGDPERIKPRQLGEANIGDYLAIYDVGAYSRNFSVSGYNSFPSATELCVEDGIEDY